MLEVPSRFVNPKIFRFQLHRADVNLVSLLVWRFLRATRYSLQSPALIKVKEELGRLARNIRTAQKTIADREKQVAEQERKIKKLEADLKEVEEGASFRRQ